MPDDIVPEDSFVLEVWSQEGELALRVEAALTAAHPLFYWPPRSGEQHAYAEILIRHRGDVRWIRGPLPMRASDASGELDYGDLSSWWTAQDGAEHVDGEWGEVVVSGASQTVEVRRE